MPIRSMAERATDRLRRVTSRQNPLVKDLRQAFHHGGLTEDGWCGIEGIRMLEEAVRSGLRFRAVFLRESAAQVAQRVLQQISSRIEAVSLPDEVFNGAVLTETPQPVAALVKLKDFSFNDLLRAPDPLIVVASGVQDPGNMGTLIRSAEAFGAAGLVAAEKTVSHVNPKAVRASAGSVFRLPVVKSDIKSAIAALREGGVRLVATSSHKAEPVDQADLRGAVAIFIGSEGAGLTRPVMAQMDATVGIPHSAKVESLNAGVAASIVLYEAARQRRTMAAD
jgi:TrmH family RNA methyltransferase